jgi:hypothetical protein
MGVLSPDFIGKISDIVARSDWPEPEKPILMRLMMLFAKRSAPPDPFGMFSHYEALKQRFLEAVVTLDSDVTEETFLALYCHVHGYEAPYTRSERAELDRLGGYWCHAGGISPILKAAPFLTPQSVSADLGAGNGLQGLLLQKLFPHRLTIQIELSSAMVAAGKSLARWLDIPRDRVEWQVGDVRDFHPSRVDFLYLYRPMRPNGPGKAFYQALAARLDQISHPVTIFSIADCLAPHLSDAFRVVYTDGHLTGFSNALSGNRAGSEMEEKASNHS